MSAHIRVALAGPTKMTISSMQRGRRWSERISSRPARWLYAANKWLSRVSHIIAPSFTLPAPLPCLNCPATTKRTVGVVGPDHWPLTSFCRRPSTPASPQLKTQTVKIHHLPHQLPQRSTTPSLASSSPPSNASSTSARSISSDLTFLFSRVYLPSGEDQSTSCPSLFEARSSTISVRRKYLHGVLPGPDQSWSSPTDAIVAVHN